MSTAGARTRAAHALADRLIAQLLAVPRGAEGPCQVTLDADDIKQLCLYATATLLEGSSLLEVQGPVTVLGDIHGHYRDLLHILDTCGHPPETEWLCLGNYVSRGPNSIEVFCLLLAYKVRYPTAVHLLRGNHDCSTIARIYGFSDEIKRRYHPKHRVYAAFRGVFDALPFAAVVNNDIFCVNAGISPELTSLEQIRSTPRPTDVPDVGLLTDLLWADPCDEPGWGACCGTMSSARFGSQVVRDFLRRHDLELLCRGHDCVPRGYELRFDRTLVMLFSARDYGTWGNDGAVMVVDATSLCTFRVFKSQQPGSAEDAV